VAASDPAIRSQIARIGGHAAAATHDTRELTAPARKAFNLRFVDEVDPDRVLPQAERERRAEQARKAYFARLALRSAQARKRRA
jgi:hypothetical protein